MAKVKAPVASGKGVSSRRRSTREERELRRALTVVLSAVLDALMKIRKHHDGEVTCLPEKSGDKVRR